MVYPSGSQVQPPGEFDPATKKEGKDIISYLDEKTDRTREREREIFQL